MRQKIFKLYVLEEDTPHIEIPPFFHGDFFPAIKKISSPLNISKIRVKEIYRFLVEESDLEIIINLLGTYANDENPTDKISPKFLLKWEKITENSAKRANFPLRQSKGV